MSTQAPVSPSLTAYKALASCWTWQSFRFLLCQLGILLRNLPHGVGVRMKPDAINKLLRSFLVQEPIAKKKGLVFILRIYIQVEIHPYSSETQCLAHWKHTQESWCATCPSDMFQTMMHDHQSRGDKVLTLLLTEVRTDKTWKSKRVLSWIRKYKLRESSALEKSNLSCILLLWELSMLRYC